MNNRPGFDKQSCKIDGLVQKSAAVAPQIQNNALYIHCLELCEKLLNVFCGAKTFGLSVQSAFAVKSGKIYNSYGNCFIAYGYCVDISLCKFSCKLYFPPYKRHYLACRRIRNRLYKQTNLCVFFSANHLDCIAEFHAYNVHNFSCFLAHSQYFVARLEKFAFFSWASRHQFGKSAVAVLVLKKRSDSHEGVPHRYVELLKIIFRKECRVRIVKAREGIKINFLGLYSVGFRIVFNKAFIAAENFFLCLGQLFLKSFGDFLLHNLCLENFLFYHIFGFVRFGGQCGGFFSRRRAGRLGGSVFFAFLLLGFLCVERVSQYLVYEVVSDALIP